MLLAAADWQRFVILLPALIIGAGLCAAVLLLLARAFVETVRESRHPRLVVGGLVALCGLIAVLTWLGVELPREGG